ncbi:GNAT family N-acetyltransferase [Peptostreptococcaceae bacterium OttesenSCG-928-C18]|nr:GNAT family N-acetyltransferase [Peptostreptococcaceae bacterium OttesenSCG-928-C18]
MKQFKLRKTTREDTGLILGFIKELADYEKMTDDVVATEELIEEHVFDKERVEVLIAEENNIPIGFCLFFYNFSTFVGRSGIYLEDIYLKPNYRGKGYGKIIFKELAKIAVERNCGRMEWVCLDWNKPSIDFYKKMGAISMDEWTTYRLTGDSLRKVAQKEI